MVTLQPPFQASKYTQLAKKILRGEYKDFPNISKELATVISSMLKVNPLERPTITQIWTLPKVQFISKKLFLERRYLAVKKREEAQRKKEVQIVKMETKLNLEQSILNEKKRRLEEKALDLEQIQNRLTDIARHLRRETKSCGLSLPANLDFIQLIGKISGNTQRLSRTGSTDGFIEAAGGGFVHENVDRKSSYSMETFSTSSSRIWSSGFISSPETVE